MTNPTISSGKVILITGASSDSGEATARHLASLGHRVMLGARRLDRIAAIAQAITAAGGDALFQQLDVTSFGSFKAFAVIAEACYGRVDVLVNLAEVMPSPTINGMRVRHWNGTIDVNLRGVLHGAAAVLPIMQAHGGGHVVNIDATAAHRRDPAASVFCATKSAMRMAWEGLMREHEDLRVTFVNRDLCHGIPGRRAMAEEIGRAIDQTPSIDAAVAADRPNAIS